jgi:hypothetical protein
MFSLATSRPFGPVKGDRGLAADRSENSVGGQEAESMLSHSFWWNDKGSTSAAHRAMATGSNRR